MIDNVTIGGTYRVMVCGTVTRATRMATVTVLRKCGGNRGRYLCRTHDTGRTVRATAKRLRPVAADRTA